MSEIDTFDNVLPLPYRVISLVVLGSWLWLLTLKISNKVGINIQILLKLDDDISNSITNLTINSLIQNHERTNVNISIISIISYLIFQLFHNKEIESLTIFDIIPLITLFIIFYILLKPNNFGSKRLFTSFKRILKGKIDQSIRTNDILLSDTLTSYSKILIDFSIYLCHIINFETCLPKISGTKINRSCGDSILLESLIGIIPTMIRLKQCLFEYKNSGKRNTSHLLNFLKYSTNIPILIISLIIKIKKIQLTKLWIFASIINSTYSFIWDVNNDWNLNLFKKLIFNGGHNNNNDILRVKLHYNFKFFYYIAIILDFAFRFIWICKFLPNFNNNSSFFYIFISSLFNTEFGLYSLQIIEILRRWIWVFIKIEVDYINLNPLDSHKIGTSIELGNLQD